MIGTVLFFTTALLLGLTLTKLFSLALPHPRSVITFIVGVVALTLILFFLGIVLPFTQITVVIELVATILVSVFALWDRLSSGKLLALARRIKFTTLFSENRSQYLVWILLTIVVVWLFGRALIVKDGNIIAGDRLVWTDWPIHLSIASSFAWGHNFPPQNPNFAGVSLIYPFMADFVSGVLLVLGASYPLAFAAPGIVLTLSFFALFVEFSSILLTSRVLPRAYPKLRFKLATLTQVKTQFGTPSRASPALNLIPFLPLILSLFWGGIGFVYVLRDAWMSPDFLAAFVYPIREYSFWQEKNLWFFTFLYSEILPQRAFLFGLPLFFAIALLLIKAWENWKNGGRRLVIVAGVLTGAMPFFHTHSLMALGLGLVGIFGCGVVFTLRQPQKFRQLIELIFLFVISSLPLLLLQLPLFLGQSPGFPFKPGWLMGDDSFIWFWFKNTGIFWPLVLLGLWKGAFNNFGKAVFVAGLCLFIVPNLFQFAAWEYDNLKILTYWYLLAAPFCVAGLMWIMKKLPLGKLLAMGLFTSLILTGLFEVGRLLNTQKTSIQLWSSSDIEFSEKIKSVTEPEATILTAAIHDHPVATLAGRKLIIGYPGNSWSWGLKDWSVREQDVRRMFQGGTEAQLLWKKYGVDYILVSDRERWFEKDVDEAFIASQTTLILEWGTSTLYKVN